MRIGPRDLLLSWSKLLRGKTPLLSIEVTRECPLRCPGCYAYAEGHAGEIGSLRDIPEYHGDELVARVLALVDRHDPIHVSLVGGEPLLRHRELGRLLPLLSDQGRVILVVTSGVLPIPPAWTQLPHVTVCVSVDGLAPEHDRRRHPATYDRILQHIAGCRVYLHWTIARQQTARTDYLDEYLAFWSGRSEVDRILVSLYTPQRGEQTPEMLPPGDRPALAARLHALSQAYPKLIAPQCIAEAFVDPPPNAANCLYARMSRNYACDLATRVEPCVLGGSPDCSQCGCAVSAALHGIAGVKLAGPLRVNHLIRASTSVASLVTRLRRVPDPARLGDRPS